MDGMPIETYAQLAAAKTSLELFHDLRAFLKDSKLEPSWNTVTANLAEMDDIQWEAFENAFQTISRVSLLVGILEGRGVLADVEQYLTGLYENTRRPGYAGASKPMERAARDAAEGVQP